MSLGCGYPVLLMRLHSHDQSACAVEGCFDTTAKNYLPIANYDPTSSQCKYVVYGCTIALDTLNFDSTADTLQGCVNKLFGCTDSNANNYVPGPNVDDGSCTYTILGCTDQRALNYDSTATISAKCAERIQGCTDSKAYNYATDANSGYDDALSAVYNAGYSSFDELQAALQDTDPALAQEISNNLKDSICLFH
eukprot:5276197-Prymnesium_polylepis.1